MVDRVHIETGGGAARDGVGRFDIDEYGTVAFHADVMRRLIGFGDAVFDDAGVFVGFDRSRKPGMLNVGVWLAIVPVAYFADAEYGSMYAVWDKFLMRQIRDYDATIAEYVEALREWICTHIVPTDDARPRLVRFASALANAAIHAAYDRREISRDDARRLSRDV